MLHLDATLLRRVSKIYKYIYKEILNIMIFVEADEYGV
jgi:hypothetical protein